MFKLNDPLKFVKGTYEATFFNPKVGNLLYRTRKAQTSQITSSVNLGPINGGIGNPTVIQIPDTPKLDVKLTAADFSLDARGLQVGSDVSYNGVEPIDEAVEAVGTTLTVSQIPCAPLGTCRVECTINNESKAYLIDPVTKVVQGFTATSGTTYCVHYSRKNPSAEQLDINTLFAPGVVRALFKLPVFSKEGVSDVMSSSKCGYLYITIPRLQFNGDVSTDGSQTTPATTVMDGTALSYEEACEAGLDCSDTASEPKLAYMVYVPVGDVAQSAVGLAVVGGEVTVAHGATAQIPVKLVMPNDTIVTAPYNGYTYNITDESKATVDTNGVVTGGSAAGDTEVVITLKSNTKLTCTANISVT